MLQQTFRLTTLAQLFDWSTTQMPRIKQPQHTAPVKKHLHLVTNTAYAICSSVCQTLKKSEAIKAINIL